MTTNEELKVMLEKMASDKTQNKVDHAVMDVRLENALKLAEKHNEALYGNGKDGLIATMRQVNKTLGTVRKLAWLAGGTLVTLFLTSIYYMVLK